MYASRSGPEIQLRLHHVYVSRGHGSIWVNNEQDVVIHVHKENTNQTMIAKNLLPDEPVVLKHGDMIKIGAPRSSTSQTRPPLPEINLLMDVLYLPEEDVRTDELGSGMYGCSQLLSSSFPSIHTSSIASKM